MAIESSASHPTQHGTCAHPPPSSSSNPARRTRRRPHSARGEFVVSGVRDRARYMGLSPRQRRCWLEDRAVVVDRTAAQARHETEVAGRDEIAHAKRAFADERASMIEAHAAEVSALRRQVLELSIQLKTSERDLAMARLQQRRDSAQATDIPVVGAEMLNAADQQRVLRLIAQFAESDAKLEKLKDKIKAEVCVAESEGFTLQGKTGIWRPVRDGESLVRSATVSIDIRTGQRYVRMRNNNVRAPTAGPVREPAVAELETAMTLERQALEARRNMIDATLTEDFDDEIKALDEQINQLQRRRNVLVTSV